MSINVWLDYERVNTNLPFIMTLHVVLWFQRRVFTKHSYIPSSCFETFRISRTLVVTIKSIFLSVASLLVRFRIFVFLHIIVTEPLLLQTKVMFLPAVSKLGSGFMNICGLNSKNPPKHRSM